MNLDELNSKLKKMIADNNAAQFGFRSGFETRKASFSFRDVDCDVYACLIDFEKAFDTV